MQMTPYTRDILRQYRAVINERRKAQDLSPVTTAQLLDSICEFMTVQHTVYLCSSFLIQGGSGIPPQ